MARKSKANPCTDSLSGMEIREFFEENMPQYKVFFVNRCATAKKVYCTDENGENVTFWLGDGLVVPKNIKLERAWEKFLRSTFGDEYKS